MGYKYHQEAVPSSHALRALAGAVVGAEKRGGDGEGLLRRRLERLRERERRARVEWKRAVGHG